MLWMSPPCNGCEPVDLRSPLHSEEPTPTFDANVCFRPEADIGAAPANGLFRLGIICADPHWELRANFAFSNPRGSIHELRNRNLRQTLEASD